MPDSRASGDPDDRTLRKNGLEWTVFAISLALIVGAVGYLGYLALRESNAPPRFEVTLGAATRQDSLYFVPLRIRNAGDQTAAAVHVEVTSGDETAEIVFDYVPRHSQRRGVVLLRRPPAAPEAHVTGYSLP